MKTNKGFSTILLIVIGLLVLGGGGYYLSQKADRVSNNDPTNLDEKNQEGMEIRDNRDKVEILSPTKDDILVWGNESKIRWEYLGDQSLTISLQSINLSGEVVSSEIIATDIPNTGEYVWTVTHEFPEWTYKIEIYPEDDYEYVSRSESFSITNNSNNDNMDNAYYRDMVDVVSETSRSDEIIYFKDKPVGYTNPMYSNIVGYDLNIGITFSIPAGIVPNQVNDGSLMEVVAYRFEDGLSGDYNDAFVVFSCFTEGYPVLQKNISYVDFSQSGTSKVLNINNIDYTYMQYDDFFLVSDLRTDEDWSNDWYCGSVMVGRELSEVHIGFLQNINYLEDRDSFFHRIARKFGEMYYKD